MHIRSLKPDLYSRSKISQRISGPPDFTNARRFQDQNLETSMNAVSTLTGSLEIATGQCNRSATLLKGVNVFVCLFLTFLKRKVRCTSGF
jgi:hypothetical protein